MYKQKQTDRIYKEGDNGFAVVESFDGVFEQTELPNEALKGDDFEPVKKRRTAAEKEE